MKQIKLFYASDASDREVEETVNNKWKLIYEDNTDFIDKVEKAVNKWIADNNIDVIDVKFGSYCTPRHNHYHECIEVMVIYKVETA